MTEKFGIKLKGGAGSFLMAFSEHTNEAKNLTPITFGSIGEAEEYAQDHEISNFAITRVRDTNPKKQNLQESA